MNMTEEQLENRLAVTQHDSERVTWMGAAELAHKRAAEAFRVRKDDLAMEFRSLASAYESKAEDASRAQDAAMRKAGMKS